MSDPAVATPRSPYKGLASFGGAGLDPVLFFGREREIEVIVANLVASRLTILYGPSGVGKTSVLRAGVEPRLRADGAAVVVFSAWSSSPVEDLLREVRERAADEEVGELYVILDQFEEYFLYHEAGGPFLELAELIRDRDVRANFLISVREDALAQLDAFKSRIPNLFGNFLRLDRLDRRAATRAIVGPLERYEELGLAAGPREAEVSLIDEILDSVTAGRIVLGATGRGAAKETDDEGGQIEAPYLQLVLERLWDVERDQSSDTLRLTTLRELGGAAHVVEEHLERAMSSLSQAERDAAAAMYNHLVTPSGTKIAHRARDLARYAAIDEGEAARVLDRLAAERIVRVGEDGAAGAHYEIFHDVLADAVLGWRAQHEAERRIESERREAARRHRRLLVFSATSLLAIAILSGIAIYALSQRSEARENARHARAGELVAQAAAALQGNPQRSLELALDAARIVRTPAVEDMLRKALRQIRAISVNPVAGAPGEPTLSRDGSFLAVIEGDTARLYGDQGRRFLRTLRHPHIEAASIGPGASRIVTVGRDRMARVWTRDGRLIHAHVLPAQVQAASFGPDGKRLVTVSGQRMLTVFDPSGKQTARFVQPSGVLSVRFSPDGKFIATGGPDEVARIWNARTGKLRLTLKGHVGRVGDVAFSPDGTMLVTGSTDGTARVWRTTDGFPVTVSPGHENAVSRVEFSPDGTLIATGSRDRRARLFDAGSPTLRATLTGHADRVADLAWTRDGSTLVTAGADQDVRFWDALRFPKLELVRNEGEGVGYVRFDVNGGISSWPPGRNDPRISVPRPLVKTIEASSPGARAFAFHGQLAVSGDDAGTARVWDARRQTTLRTLPQHQALVTSARFSPDGRHVVTTSLDHDVRLSDVETGRQVWVLSHSAVVSDADFSSDGRWVVIAGPGEAGVVDASTGERMLLLDGRDRILTSVDFSPAGWRIASGGERGAVRSYDCRLCGGIDELVKLAEERLEQLRPRA